MRADRFYLLLPQFEVNIGSSMVANGIMGMVVGYITHLVVDMAFLIQVRTALVL